MHFSVAHMTRVLLLLLLVIGFSGCDDSNDNPTNTGDATDSIDAVDPSNTPCDVTQDIACSLPWPSSRYLTDDDSTYTGKRLVFPEGSLPEVEQGPIDGSPWSRLDGYGVGTPILFAFPHLDLTGLASEQNMGPSLEADHPIKLFEVQEDGSLKDIRFWVEKDSQDPEPKTGVTWMRPAKILKEATQYIVAIRHIQNTVGDPFAADSDFVDLRDGTAASNPDVVDRQEHYNKIFNMLETEAGIERSSLTLAWSFTTASSETLHGDMIDMRDKALEAVETSNTSMTFDTGVEEFSCDELDLTYNSGIRYEITGTFTTPYYMKPADDSSTDPLDLPSIFNKDEAGEITQNGTREADFWAMVPCSAVGPGASPAGIIQYGHGLLGKGSQVFGGFNKRIAREYNYIFFASNWTGMASPDVSSIIEILSDPGNMPYLVDRMHQGVIEFVVLGELMQEVFPAHPEITNRDIQVDPDRYYYSGISQGGIYGGVFAAVSKAVTAAHLGVPGQNYSLLLHRSVDFNPYFEGLKLSIPEPVEQAIALSLMQQLWDQVDPSSYLHHLSVDPFTGNDPTYAIFAPAKGDHQVSPLTNLIAANSDTGIAVMNGYGRDTTNVGVTQQDYMVEGSPYVGSAIVSWDLGNPWPSPGNMPPDDSAFCWQQLGETPTPDCQSAEDCLACDPHGTPRYFPSHQEQMMHFFETGGEVIDVCGGNGCIFRTTDCWGDECSWTEQ